MIRDWLIPVEHSMSTWGNVAMLMHFINGERITHREFIEDLTPEQHLQEDKSAGSYRRGIFVYGDNGLHDKESNPLARNLMSCASGIDQNGRCGDASAKEFRFCSYVLSIRPYVGHVHICATMTNFFE